MHNQNIPTGNDVNDLNDFWILRLGNLTWTKLEIQGISPSP